MPRAPTILISERFRPVGPGRSQLRPVVADPNGTLRLSETPSMGKGAFVERSIRIAGISYAFVQWKGVGRNRINHDLPVSQQGIGTRVSFPFGDQGRFPLFLLQHGTKIRLRFLGGAFYEDLCEEAVAAARLAEIGVRVPVTLATHKFSREFCAQNGLPIPAINDPTSVEGGSLRDFIQARRDSVNDRTFRTLLRAREHREGYRSAILGESVRAFRNVWRVDDVESVSRCLSGAMRRHALETVMQVAASRFASEFGDRSTLAVFIHRFAEQMGGAAKRLRAHGLVHEGLRRHLQDVTLAAELCDADGLRVFPRKSSLFARQDRRLEECVRVVARAARACDPDIDVAHACRLYRASAT